ncbi:MAG: response regulator transcription factor [Verrucomicrobia bacterium]|nr:response regulator transcription factor [Verrucomicrobiota bacterium]
MPPLTTKRILIVDDHPMIREGLRTLISREPDLSVCGEAETAAEGLKATAELNPDLVLVDIGLPGRNGLELIKDLRAFHPALPILVLSMHDELLWAERVLRAGARGYVMKRETGPVMVQAIRQVLANQLCVSEKISARILESFAGHRVESSPLGLLSDREFEVFELIGRGKSTTDIAAELHLSTKTVEAHRAKIKEKLELRTMPELISFAARWVETQDTR